MEIFLIKLLYIFIYINNIIALSNDNILCPEGKYGQDCSFNCSCDKWSTSNSCSKLEGRCLDCKFGKYGKNCESECYPECKSYLCCAIKSSDFKESNFKLNIKKSIMNIQINGVNLNISVDYNIGYPLSIFKKSTKIDLGKMTDGKIYSYSFSKYKVSGKIYENNKIKFLNQENFNIDITLPIILDETINPEDKNINGVIGLGYSNSINNQLIINNKTISENIASYEKKGEDINVIFGDLFKEEKKYVHRLSSCKTENSNNIECKLDGFGSKKYSDVLKINDKFIKFSLDKESKFVFPYNENYINYIEKYYFTEGNYEIKNDNKSTTYFCYKKDKINQLNEFGFVINHFLYFFPAEYFFEEDGLCNNGFSTFLIKFSNQSSEIILGKNFYEDTIFTLDHEENQIYFYSKYVEYFPGKIKTIIEKDLSKIITPLNSSIIVIGISLFLNFASFLVYFYFERKKEILKLKDY